MTGYGRVSVPDGLRLHGEPEQAAAVLMTVGAITRSSALLDHALEVLAVLLEDHAERPFGKSTSHLIGRCRTALAATEGRLPVDLREWLSTQIAEFDAFRERRNRLVHDVVLPGSESAVRRRIKDGEVQSESDSIRDLIAAANWTDLRVAVLNAWMLTGDVATWRASRASAGI